ncbi:MAG TPA: acyl-CoA dehydrogenase family protein [Hyphomicrobiaceae bacterium]|nr:acyl-CoA dehydrogenase family protein [Hyphomicrobiaceae bacterium]
MSDSSESIVLETTRRILADLADPQTLNAARNESWKAPVWQALEESGLTLAWVPEEQGGVGASISDGFDILRMAGQFASPVALGETLLAGWLLGLSGQACPSGPMTLAPVRDRDRITVGADGTLTGTARAVPFARDARTLAVLVETDGHAAVAIVDPAACTMTDRNHDMGGDRSDISFTSIAPISIARLPDGISRDDFWIMAAAARAAQMTGALESCLAVSTQYAMERQAFGRTISKFQAVQHNLAKLAGEVAASLAASGSAADTLENERDNRAAVFLEAAAAKIRVGEAARDGIAIAHQVHGAIGFTSEYVLQRFTRCLMGWRDDFGEESVWAVKLGNAVAEKGEDQLWPTLTTR